MPVILVVFITATLIGCGTYKGSEMWRLSTCRQIVDADERARCEKEATRSESEYEQDVEQALEN